MIEKYSLRFINSAKSGSDEFVGKAYLRHSLDTSKNYKMTLNKVEVIIKNALIGDRILNVFSNIPV